MRGFRRRYTKISRDNTSPAQIPQYMDGAARYVITSVVTATNKSRRDVCHSIFQGCSLNKPSTDATTTAASTAFGTQASTGKPTASTIATTTQQNTFDQPDCAPANRFSAERENDVLTGKAPHSAALSLAAPCPIRSWSRSQRSPDCTLSRRALAAVSMKLINAITRAGTTSSKSCCTLKLPGSASWGKPAGSGPTTPIPSSSQPHSHAAAAVRTSRKKTAGIDGRSRLQARMKASDTTPNTADGRCHEYSTPLLQSSASNAGSCEVIMSKAAACVKAINTGPLTRSISQP